MGVQIESVGRAELHGFLEFDSNLNDVGTKVKEDLGFTLEMTALDSDSVAQRAATQPKSFDIADIEYWICKKVWPTGNMQAMDVWRITLYDQISPIFTDHARAFRMPMSRGSRSRNALSDTANHPTTVTKVIIRKTVVRTVSE